MTRLSKEMLQSFADELEKAAGIPKGLRELAKKKQRWGAGEYAVRREAAHKFGNKATKPRKYEIWATGSGLEARTPKNPNPSQLSVKADVNEGKRWRKMSKEQLGKFEKNKKASAGVEEVEKTAGLPSYLKKMTKKEFGVTKITEWPKDRRLQDVLSQHQAGKQLPLVGKARKGQAAKEVRERSAAGFREGTAEHKWKNSKNSLKSKTAGIPKGLKDVVMNPFASSKARSYAMPRFVAHSSGRALVQEGNSPLTKKMSEMARKAAREQLPKNKKASAGLELAGLGVLAAPSVGTLMDRKADKKEKSHAKFETAGLGILAAHPAYEIGQKALGLGKKVLTKKAAPSQAAMMKMHAMVDASKAAKNVAPATAQGTLRPASQAAHAGYADFMPAGRFSGAGQGLPSIQQRSMQHAQKVMAAGGKMAPLQRVSAGAAQTGGVLGRIGKMFRGA